MRGQREQSSSAEAWGEDRTCASQDPDKNSGNIPLVQSVLCAGLYPHVAAFMRPNPQREVSARVDRTGVLMQGFLIEVQVSPSVGSSFVAGSLSNIPGWPLIHWPLIG